MDNQIVDKKTPIFYFEASYSSQSLFIIGQIFSTPIDFYEQANLFESRWQIYLFSAAL